MRGGRQADRAAVGAAAFAVVREVATEHALGQQYGSCLCGHVQDTHLGRWGRCQGPGCAPEGCSRFRGVNRARQRELERFGVALLARLREPRGGRPPARQAAPGASLGRPGALVGLPVPARRLEARRAAGRRR
jgi:hypothetical protein